MRFTELPLHGAYVIAPDPIEDDRGFFARTWCAKTAEAHGLRPQLVQCSVSFSRHQRTLRGMHYQIAPHQEAKVVRCTAGAIHDVILDLRRESRTYGRWHTVELTAANHLMLYVPEGFAHGFQTLTDNTEVFYQMSAFYEPAAARGIRWNDAAFGIEWPLPDPILSPKDAGYRDFMP